MEWTSARRTAVRRAVGWRVLYKQACEGIIIRMADAWQSKTTELPSKCATRQRAVPLSVWLLMKLPFTLLILISSLLLSIRSTAEQPKPVPVVDPSAQWENEIVAMETADKADPPAKGGVLFIGSSTIRFWKSLAADFPQHHVINHGFGGSQIVDSTHFAPRLIFPFEPQMIFLRAGGNDIHAGKSPEQVFADYKEFVAAVQAKLPLVRIIYIGLFPTIDRIREVEKGDILDGYIKAYVSGKPLLGYVDCDDLTKNAEGRPRAELFMSDGLHLNAAGYKLLAERTRPFLPPPVVK